MNIQLKMNETMPCEVEEFSINGKRAKVEDFGNLFSHKMEKDACTCIKFEPLPYGSLITKRYKLTEDEYDEVCSFLEDNTFMSCCSKCFVKK